MGIIKKLKDKKLLKDLENKKEFEKEFSNGKGDENE